MKTLEKFYEKYSLQTVKLKSGKNFNYRYHKKENSKVTIVLLTGEIGLSNLFYLHFQRFANVFR